MRCPRCTDFATPPVQRPPAKCQRCKKLKAVEPFKVCADCSIKGWCELCGKHVWGKKAPGGICYGVIYSYAGGPSDSKRNGRMTAKQRSELRQKMDILVSQTAEEFYRKHVCMVPEDTSVEPLGTFHMFVVRSVFPQFLAALPAAYKYFKRGPVHPIDWAQPLEAWLTAMAQQQRAVELTSRH